MKINYLEAKLLVFLLVFYSVFFVFLGLVARFIVGLIFYYKGYPFSFTWEEDVIISIKQGVSAGLVLGFGLWIKSKLEERKSRGSAN